MLRPEKIVFSTIALLLSMSLAAPAALATPPAHAPANGWRAQQQPHYARQNIHRQNIAYGDRRGNCNGDDLGAVLGAVGGGVIGGNVVKGDNQMIAILTGAAIGGVIGHQIGRASDSGCGKKSYRPGQVRYPVQQYYPQAYYPNPRATRAVRVARPAYVVPAPRYVYASQHRPADHGSTAHRHDRRDNRDNRDRRRDERRHDNDGRGDGRYDRDWR